VGCGIGGTAGSVVCVATVIGGIVVIAGIAGSGVVCVATGVAIAAGIAGSGVVCAASGAGSGNTCTLGAAEFGSGDIGVDSNVVCAGSGVVIGTGIAGRVVVCAASGVGSGNTCALGIADLGSGNICTSACDFSGAGSGNTLLIVGSLTGCCHIAGCVDTGKAGKFVPDVFAGGSLMSTRL
jgi:hypothetical protein